MPQPKRGLGKGLGALIPTAPASVAPGPVYAGAEPHEPLYAAVAGAYFEEVPVGAVTPNPRQPRQKSLVQVPLHRDRVLDRRRRSDGPGLLGRPERSWVRIHDPRLRSAVNAFAKTPPAYHSPYP